MEIIFGTRKSKWALAATNAVIQSASLHSPKLSFKIVQLDSPGDLNHGDLAKLGGTTSFVDALSREVAARTIDAAVHTIKDISWPSEVGNLPDGTLLPLGLRTTGNLVLPAVGKRNDPRDTLVMRVGESMDTFANRPIRMGTGSRVRAATIRLLYPEAQLNITKVRGNMDLRLDMLDRGDYDALLVSMDGLLAVGQDSRATRIFSVDEMPPALGQAIGAAETCDDNRAALDALLPVNDLATQTCLRAEWTCMRVLKATCYTPVGGLCVMNGDGRLAMFAAMYGPDGEYIRESHAGLFADCPEILGAHIAAALLAKGAARLEESWNATLTELSQDAN